MRKITLKISKILKNIRVFIKNYYIKRQVYYSETLRLKARVYQDILAPICKRMQFLDISQKFKKVNSMHTYYIYI